MFSVKSLLKEAKSLNKTIVFPEADNSERVLKAVEIVIKKKLANVVLLGDPNSLYKKSKKIHGATIINPKTSELNEEFINKLVEIRKDKGLNREEATELLKDNFYFASMMVEKGYADGFVGGAEIATSKVLRPALQIIKTKEGIKTASACVMFVGTKKLGFGENNVLFVGDAALNINPNAEQLADIAIATSQSAKTFAGISPRVAMLSFSSFGSGGDKDESVLKIRQAIKIAKSKDPNLQIDGEMQLDCAIIESVAKLKGKSSSIAGHANVLIFPDLNAGNIGYKLMERFGKLQAVGIIMQGFNKPINDLSRGCSVKDIVVMTAVTCLQAKNK